MARAAKKNILRIAVRDFAVPLKKRGSIGTEHASGLNLDLGQEIHGQFQAELSANWPEYQSEVFLQKTVAEGAVRQVISGRCDGYFAGEQPILEEIKSTFSWERLQQDLQNDPEHPYWLQIKTYLYLHYCQHQQLPQGQLRLVCSRTRRQQVWPVPFDLDEFATWFAQRVEQIEAEWLSLQQEKQRRQDLHHSLAFPYPEMRASQKELIDFLQRRLRKAQQLMLQAPTGLGKTAGVLFPVLSRSLERGAPVVYVAPKNSQFQAALAFARACRDNGYPLRVLVLTARAKACLNAEVNCSADSCELAKDYYARREPLLPTDTTQAEGDWDRDYFARLGKTWQVCPYELSMDHLRRADLIIADYNYLFSLRPAFFERYEHPYLPMPKPLLVIDEAHNLYHRAMENFSPSLSQGDLESLRDAEQGRDAANPAMIELITASLSLFHEDQPGREVIPYEPDRATIYEILGQTRQLIVDLLAAGVSLTMDDPLLGFYGLMSDWSALLDYEGEDVQWVQLQASGQDRRIKALCLDPAQFLSPLHQRFDRVVAFSATLKPFEFYANLSGLDAERYQSAEFASPFPREHKKVMIVPQIATTYRERAKHYQRIADIIARVTPLAAGHYFAFFPSYRFLTAVSERLQALALPFKLLLQQPGMSPAETQTLFDSIHNPEEPCLLLAVQGGSFAEGVDFKGCGVAGVFIVGPGVPAFSLERQLMSQYYQKRYQRGHEYAFIYPAMARSIQAAGRVVRDLDERGLVMLLDRRFLMREYAATMPADWYEQGPQELVSQRILADIETFWQSPDTNV
jgi:DNA excision repair protein ERCC-2